MSVSEFIESVPLAVRILAGWAAALFVWAAWVYLAIRTIRWIVEWRRARPGAGPEAPATQTPASDAEGSLSPRGEGRGEGACREA